MAKFDIQRCHVCGEIEFEDKMLEYNDKFYCGLSHKLQQERKDNESLNNLNTDRAQLRDLGKYRK